MIRGKIQSYSDFVTVMRCNEPYTKIRLLAELQKRDKGRYDRYMKEWRKAAGKTEYMRYRWKWD